METRTLDLAHNRVTLAYDGEWAERLAQFVLGASASRAITSPPVMRLVPDPAQPRLLAHEVGGETFASASDAAMGEHLLRRLAYHLADQCQRGAVFHAAAVSWGGRALVLPAGPGSGKTTLTAWLLAHGLTLLTDELTHFPEGTTEAHGLARPLNIKPGSWEIIQPLRRLSAPAPLSGPGVNLFAPACFTALPPQACAEAALFLFPRFVSAAAFELAPLTPAQASVALTQCCLNARNLPQHGFPEMMRLAKHIPAYRLTYGGFDQLRSTGFLDRVKALLA